MNAADQVAQLQADELSVFRAIAGQVGVHAMIDVGAHHGATAAPFLDAGWPVWAFEPVEANREILRKRDDAGRLTVRPEAVSDHCGTAQLHMALHLDGSTHDYYHSLERTGADRYHRKGAVVDVPVVSLDDLAARGELPGRVGFLKIDTEGHDLAVLRGAGRLECDVVGVEFWRDRHPLGRSPSPAADMIRLMAGRGYESYLVVCHQAGGVRVLGSTFEGVHPDAWGNILFFHPSCTDLYRRLLGELAGSGAGAAPADTRLVRLLSLAFPDRKGLVVLQAEGEAEACAASLTGPFPDTRGVRFRPAGGETADAAAARAGAVDLLRLAAPADASALLRGAGRLLAEGRPAVLLSAALASPADGQPAFFEVLRTLQGSDYRLTGLVAPLVSEEGLLASADFLFLPPALHARCAASAGVVSHEDTAALLEQTRVLQQVCDERLTTLNAVHASAAAQLAVMRRQEGELKAKDDELKRQDGELRRKDDELKRVAEAAEERLQLIRRLDEHSRATHEAAEERLRLIQRLDEETRAAREMAAAGQALIQKLEAEARKAVAEAEERLEMIRRLNDEKARRWDVRLWSQLRRVFGRRAAS